MYLMMGSQQFALMKNVSESLSGRIGIQVLPGLSLREKNKERFRDVFLPDERYFSARKKTPAKISYEKLWNEIQKGDRPELFSDRKIKWDRYYGAYLRTYIERDVRQLTQIGDERKFLTFMTAAASVSGSLLNLSELARDTGVSVPTAGHLICRSIFTGMSIKRSPRPGRTLGCGTEELLEL